MDRHSDYPVFQYLWFHHCSRLTAQPRRLLVLGAGAFTAPKCLALSNPNATIDAVDIEPDLHAIGRRYFRLGEPAFGGIRFHGLAAAEFLRRAEAPYDFVFDDLFDGFQHIPDEARTRDHVALIRRLLGDGAILVKNVIWNPNSAPIQAACTEAQTALAEVFPESLALALGPPQRGHNRLLIGSTSRRPLTWSDLKTGLAGQVPASLLENVQPLSPLPARV